MCHEMLHLQHINFSSLKSALLVT